MGSWSPFFLLMINPAHIADDQMARIVYLTIQAASTVLHAYGADSDLLYAPSPNDLSIWGAHSRGNLLVLLRVALDTIAESDRRRGYHNARGQMRFFAARLALNECMVHALLMPSGRVQGRMPLIP